MRKEALSNGETYHIFTRSIADYKVFNNDADFDRMKQLVKYYQIENDAKFSDFIGFQSVKKEGFNNFFEIISQDKEFLVQIIAYCFMPTHIHLVLRQLHERGIIDYMRRVLNGYSSYFNRQHRRKGPLWESRFKNVLVNNNEQLLHLTRYIHLNPVTARLVDNPEEWHFSSYGEYLAEIDDNSAVCQFGNLLEIKPKTYQKFVNAQKSYQRELAKIKNLLIE